MSHHKPPCIHQSVHTCSTPTTVSAEPSTANAQLISAEPPPYTMRLSRTRFRATHSASCRLRLTSSNTILLPPRTKMVTADRLGQPSMMMFLSLVVPKPTSRTLAAEPSLSGVSSCRHGSAYKWRKLNRAYNELKEWDGCERQLALKADGVFFCHWRSLLAAAHACLHATWHLITKATTGHGQIGQQYQQCNLVMPKMAKHG